MSITDMRNSRVQVLDKDFPLVTQWGSYGNGSGKFSLTFPGIDIYEKAGLVFVIDKIEPMFRFLINLENSFLNFGSKGTGEGQFKRPEDIAIDPQGRIFVCGTENSRIQIFSKND
jgi:NHL repeat